MKWLRNPFIILLILVAVISVFFQIFPPEQRSTSPSYITERELVRLAKADLVDSITVGSNQLRVIRADTDARLLVRIEPGTDVYALLEQGGVPDEQIDDIWIEEQEAKSFGWADLFMFVPMLLLVGLVLLMVRLVRSIHAGQSSAAEGTGRSLSEGVEGAAIFRSLPEAFPEIYKQGIRRQLFHVLIIISAMLAVGIKFAFQDFDLTNLIIVVVPVAIFVVALGIGLVRAIRIGRNMTRAVWESYELLIIEDVVKRRQFQLPDVDIRADEITAIEEEPGRGIVIRTARSGVSIGVPAAVDRYEEAKDRLGQMRVIQQSARISRAERAGLLYTLAAAALFVVAMIVDSLVIAPAAGAAFAVLLICYLVAVRRERNVPLPTKQTAPVVLFFLLAVVVKLFVLVLPLLEG